MIPRAAARSAFLAALLAVVCSAPALGQTVAVSQPPVPEPAAAATPAGAEQAPADGIDRVTEGAVRRSLGVRAEPQQAAMRLRPGGDLLRTFDANRDASISAAELTAGAAAAFRAADADQDGLVTGLEQSAWAKTFGGVDSVLSNSMLFDADLNRMVTEQEFVAGVQRLAEPVRDASGVVPVASLMAAVQPERGPGIDLSGTLTPRGQTTGGGQVNRLRR